MQMAQVVQHRFIFFAHTAREVRIIQVLVARGFRHVFQHVQPASNGPLPVRRQLLPSRQDIVLDVIPLLRRQSAPDPLPVAQLLLLLR